MPVLLAEHSFDCNLCHVVARHGCTHQHGRDRIEIHHSRFCGAKIVFFSGSVVGLIAHIPFCAWQSVELVFWAVCCESLQNISDDWLWIWTIKFGDNAPIPWQAVNWTWSCSALPSELGPCPVMHLYFWFFLGVACLWHYRFGDARTKFCWHHFGQHQSGCQCPF